MRTLALISVLLLTIGVLAVAPSAAGDEPQGAAERIASLERELRLERLGSEKQRLLIEHLDRFTEDLIGRLAESESMRRGSPDSAQRIALLEETLRAERQRHTADVTQLQQELAASNARRELVRREFTTLTQQVTLHAATVNGLKQKLASLGQQLAAEQERHVMDVSLLQTELAKANHVAELNRMQATRCQQQKQAAEEKQNEAQKEMDRLRWAWSRRMPTASIAREFTYVPASHWIAELGSNDTIRVRVALTVLAVVPAKDGDAVNGILDALWRHRSLLDTGTPVLVRIGAPAVPALVAAGKETGRDALPRAWVVHVLGQLGPAAAEALPWLESISKGDDRDAEAVRGTIERILAE